MKIPKKIKVGGHVYRVIYPCDFAENKNLRGQHDGDTKEIRISDDGPESVIAETLLHEILHAVDSVTGYKLFEDNERAIVGIGEALFQVLRDNNLDFRDKS